MLLSAPPSRMLSCFIDPPWGPGQPGIQKAPLLGLGLLKQDPGMRLTVVWISKEQEGTWSMSPQGVSEGGNLGQCVYTYPLPMPGTAFLTFDFSSKGLTTSTILRGLFISC